MTKPQIPGGRVFAELKAPKNNVSAFITYARWILVSMTKAPWFPSPRPSFGKISSAIDALEVAQVRALTRAAGAAATRDAKRAAVMQLLQQLVAYIQTVADANPNEARSIIESAGVHVRRSRVLRGRTFAANQGRVSGEVVLVAPVAGQRAMYHWRQSNNGGKTWIDLRSTLKATTTVNGLERGSTVWFQYRADATNAQIDWSDWVSILVE